MEDLDPGFRRGDLYGAGVISRVRIDPEHERRRDGLHAGLRYDFQRVRPLRCHWRESSLLHRTLNKLAFMYEAVNMAIDHLADGVTSRVPG